MLAAQSPVQGDSGVSLCYSDTEPRCGYGQPTGLPPVQLLPGCGTLVDILTSLYLSSPSQGSDDNGAWVTRHSVLEQ